MHDKPATSEASNGTAIRLLSGVAGLRHDPAGIRFLLPYLRSLGPGRSPLADGMPWLTFRAIHWLASNIDHNMRVFEYGSGGSTLFLARRVAELVSVEHDPEWYTRTTEALHGAGIRNCTYLLRPPKLQAAVRFGSSDPAYAGLDFADYVTAVDSYPDASFDLVCVDGRARPACLLASLGKVSAGGFLLLDNSDRPHYAEAVNALDGYERLNLRGIAPYSTEVTETTIWRISNLNDG